MGIPIGGHIPIASVAGAGRIEGAEERGESAGELLQAASHQLYDMMIRPAMV